jgi:hypothetical protein
MKRLLVAAMCACVVLLAVGPAYADGKKPHQYAGATKCRSCHEKDGIGNQYGKWLESKHARAFDTLASDKAKEWGKDRGVESPQTSDKCVKCHVAGYGAPKAELGMKYGQKEGVTCEACHGPGSDYRKKKIMMDQKEAVKHGLVLQSEKVCTTCHNDESPAWDPKRYKLAGGKTAGFDYEQAKKAIAHAVPAGYDPSKDDTAE